MCKMTVSNDLCRLKRELRALSMSYTYKLKYNIKAYRICVLSFLLLCLVKLEQKKKRLPYMPYVARQRGMLPNVARHRGMIGA